MGLTHLKARIANPASLRKAVNVKLLVDSGAVYSVVPAAILRRIGIKPHSERTFFIVDGLRAASPVIFGEEDDSALLGVVSLEALGLILDPMKRVLRPLPMILGSMNDR